MRFPFRVLHGLDDARQNFEALEGLLMARKVAVASSGATLAVGGQFSTTLNHNLGSTAVYPIHLGFQDGAWSHQLGWRWAVVDANNLAITYINVGPNAGAWGFHNVALLD